MPSDRAADGSDELNVQATPSFFLVRPGQPPHEIEIASLSPAKFARDLATAAIG